jgi:hypothetical protein
MKTMANDSNATVRETPHTNRISKTNTIVNALKERAEAVLNDRSIDSQSRAIIRHALETNDLWLARLVRSVDAGEDVFEAIEVEAPNLEKIEALAEIICGTEKSAAALFLLVGIIEDSKDPRILANAAKQTASTRCGELSDLLAGMS